MKNKSRIRAGLAILILALTLPLVSACHRGGINIDACEKGRVNFKRYFEEQPARVQEIAIEVMGDRAEDTLAADFSDLEARKLQIEMLEIMLKEIKVDTGCAEYFLEKGIPTTKAAPAEQQAPAPTDAQPAQTATTDAQPTQAPVQAQPATQ